MVAGSLYLLYGLLCLAGVGATIGIAWVLVRVGRAREARSRARRAATAAAADATLPRVSREVSAAGARRRVLTEKEAAAEARSAAGGPT